MKAGVRRAVLLCALELRPRHPPFRRDESADLSILALLLGVVLFGIAIRRELRAHAP
jgi:hypothetical protein